MAVYASSSHFFCHVKSYTQNIEFDHHLNGDLPPGPGSSSLKTFLLKGEPSATHLSSFMMGVPCGFCSFQGANSK